MKLLNENKQILNIFFILSFLLSSINLYSQIDNKKIEALETLIDSIVHMNIQSQNIPGAAYILVDKEKVLLKKGFGLATIDDNNEVNPDSTIFRIGSISKTFTVVALLQLLERNEIDLHEDVNNYLKTIKVQDISEMDLETYLRKNIWIPLDMNMTSIMVPEKQSAYISPGYEFNNGVNIPQPWEWYHTYPSSEINSTVSDMGKYLKFLLNHGIGNENQLLSYKMASKMTQQQLSPHKEVDGFAYGFYERTRHNVKSICHGGNMLGYSSMLTLIPEMNMGFFIVNHHEESNLRNKVNDAILKFFETKNEEENQNQRWNKNTDLEDFEGEYQWMTFCHSCPNSRKPKIRRITENEDNTLSGFGRKFYQVEPLVFKSFDGQRTIGFIKDELGKIKYLSLGNINTFEKIK